MSNEGFAFNEGWAYFTTSAFNPAATGTFVPNGTWGSPSGDDVEGDVANQLFNLAQTCGGFARLWQTMKDAGPTPSTRSTSTARSS